MRARLILALLLLGSLLALLLGCGAPPQGEVTEKQYTPSYSWTEMRCITRNAQAVCTSYMPVQHVVPDRYSLHLVDGEEQGWRDVTVVEYDYHEVGDWYPKSR